MKFLNKLVIPFLLVILITLIYTIYFSGNNELGLFSNFDTNNNANKEIRVKVVQEKGINMDQQKGTVTFYASDKNRVEYLVQAPYTENLETTNEVILNGHLHPDHFHATEIKID